MRKGLVPTPVCRGRIMDSMKNVRNVFMEECGHVTCGEEASYSPLRHFGS